MNHKAVKESEGYKVSRYFTPSSLTASQAAKKKKKRGRRSYMSPSLTYRVLMDEQARTVQLGNLREQTAANRATALRGFMRENALNLDDVVGDEMRMRHPEALERFIESLQNAERSARSITNSRCALRPWREAVVQHDTILAQDTEHATPFVQALKPYSRTRA